MELSGKNVFITGSTRGLGLAIAHAFARQGSNIVLNGRSQISQEILESFKKYRGTVLYVSGDVSSLEDSQRMISEATDKLGAIDVLVNNAGITKDKLFSRMTSDDFEQVLSVNLMGAFNMMKSAIKLMSKAKQGAIINMSSVSGIVGNIGQANYAASKSGLIGLTKTIAREMAGRNVRVNVLAPGMIISDMTDELSEKSRNEVISKIPMKRMGLAEEVAEAVVFLAKQEYMTGQVLTIDGGLTM